MKQLHRDLLRHSEKDQRHGGEFKKFPNSVEDFDPYRKILGVIFETTSPFDTPQKMQELLHWTREVLEVLWRKNRYFRRWSISSTSPTAKRALIQ